MEREGDEVHLDTEEASGGDKDKSMSYVLVIGTLLAILALSVIWITGAYKADRAVPAPPQAAASPAMP
jgi:hypothetical protein